ncbi:hypothetical protein CAEBREN_01202 [Caenorhabditis brenneri]|uniref:BRCT domain-containing protein n=1 Tax=Caenorhabditis brenneri TaxID=135651 RepID=G0P644_CAEBE|nr:hypothetical protein CAEBREN_01202 [Caenorhabditis brenneri]
MKSIFWIIILLIPSVLPNGTKDKSDLGLIAADFQTLSRVTNAIVLQAAITEKTVDANEVIAEFLHITPGDFAEIVRIDAANAISMLDGLKNVTSKLSTSQMSMEELDSFKKSLNNIDDSLQIFGELSPDSVEENFKNSLMELKTNATLLGNKCNYDSFFDTVRYAKVIMEQVEGYKGNPEDNQEKMDGLDKLLEELDKISDCYGSLPEYGQRIENLTFWEAAENYEKMVRTVLQIPDTLQNLQNSSNKLKSDLQTTMTAWKNVELLKRFFGTQILHAYKAHIGYSNQLTAPSEKLTGAFIETTDTRKIFDDLDSAWFKKHVVRGASTHELKKSLWPFRKMSNTIINLHSKWISFLERGFSNDDQDALRTISFSLKKLEDIFQSIDHSKSAVQYIDNINEILAECVLTPEDDTEEVVKKYKLQEQSRTAVKEALHEMNSHLNTDKTAYQDVKNITKYVDCLNVAKESVPETRQADNVYAYADKMKAKFFKCSEQKLTLKTFLKYLTEFGKIQKNLDKALKNLKGDDSGRITLKEVLSKSNGGESVKRLREKEFTTQHLSRIVDFVSSLRAFPESTSIDLVTGYLRRIAEIKSVLSNTVSVFTELGSRSKRDTYVESDSIPILENSTLHAQTISECTRALLDLAVVRNSRKELTSIGSHFTDSIVAAMEEANVSKTVIKAPKSIDKLLKQADKIDVLAKDLRSQPLRNMSKVFWEVSKIDGFDQERQKIWNLKKKHEGDLKFRDVMSEWDTLIHTNLDFARYKRSLKKGFTTVLALDKYFDQLFHSKRRVSNENQAEDSAYIYLIVFGSIGFFVFLFFAAAIIYGCTESGKERYTNWFLYWRGKSSDYEKRWRYSRFSDYGGGNVSIVLSDALNVKSLPKTLSKGHYINAYDVNGETALHEATRYCKPENVKTLIKHGIDRTLLNKSNKTAEELIPKKPTEETAAGFAEIQEIFNKYRNKKFRKSIPHRFKPSQYNIWMTEGTDEKTRDAFHEKFPRISKYEAEGIVTHVVVKVDDDGVYETNDPKMLSMIFRGCILVKESWLGACNRNGSAIEHDNKHLVEKVKYEGEVYNTVLKWANAMAKSEMPYLFGVSCLVFIPEGLLNPEVGKEQVTEPMRFWILVIAFLIPWSFTNGEPKEKSDLELITADFQILARVTNAITLQMAAIKKEVNVRVIIAELLKITYIYFENIVSIDAAGISTKLKDFAFDVEKFRSKNNQIKLRDFNNLKRYWEEFYRNRDYCEKIKHKSLTLEEFKSMTSKVIGELKLFANACPDNVLSVVLGLDEEITNDASEFSKRLENFDNNIPAFVECFKKMEQFREYLSTPLKSFGIYLEVVKVLEDIPENLNDITNGNDKLGSAFLDVLLFWNDDSKSDVPSQIVKAYKGHLDHSEQLEPTLAAYTVAFLDPQDLLKVKKDLQSPWFKKHIIRGASSKDLEKYLEPFHQASIVVQDLVKTWAPFHRLVAPGYPGVAEVGNFLSQHEGYMKGHRALRFEKVIENARSSVKKCMEHIKPNDFIKRNTVFSFLVENLENFEEELVSWFPSKLKNQKNKTKSEIVEECLRRMNVTSFDTSEKGPLWIMTTINSNYVNCMDENRIEKNWKTFLEGIKRIKVMTSNSLTAANELEGEMKNGTWEGFDAKLALKETGMDDGINCLRENINSTNMHNAINSVHHIFNAPNPESFKSTLTYLDFIIQIKSALEKVENKIREVESRPKRAAKNYDLITSSLNHSKLHGENIGVCTLALANLIEVRENREKLSKVGSHFDDKFREYLQGSNLGSFAYPQIPISILLNQSDDLNVLAGKLRTKSLMEMAQIFEEVAKLRGVGGNRQVLSTLTFSKNKQDLKEEVDLLVNINLDFTLYESRVKDGYFTIKALQSYFDLILGHTKGHTQTIIVEKHVQVPNALSWLAIICISVGVVFLILIIALTIYGFTAKGKEKYRNLYFYYFGKPADFEKRWRYSCFADKEDGKNALLDAVREVNKINTLACLKKGAYIDAYNQYGNTALHSAARLGYSELVEILIRHGADRSLLNVGNLTAEQCVPVKGKDKTEASMKVQAIFAKYKKKKFRKQVPLRFPSSSFHIYIEDDTDEKLTDAFVEKFQAITSFELGTKTTHCVVKTDANGILETDSLELLSLIFHGIIFVKESWMKDCCENPKLIEQDFKYLVEKVRYKGKVYDTVVQWSMAMAKGEIPYLYNIVVAVVMTECDNFINLNNMVIHHGSNIAESFPTKEQYRIGARPYLHAHLGPIFLIHNGKFDLTLYKNDPDKMYTLFTEEEFLIFMLKREINRDTRENPLSIYPDAMLANF